MKINDPILLKKIEMLIFHDGDVRPVWVSGGDTDVVGFKKYLKWVKEHFALYEGFFNVIDKEKKINILDLGCGCGYCTIETSNVFNNANIVGVDIDSQSIDFANEHNKNEKIEYVCADISNIKYQDYDIVFLIETLEHIKHNKHNSLLDNCIKFLNEDGLLCICTPNEQTFSGGERGHVGILTNEYFNKFKERYKNNIVAIKYYDNKKLLDGDYTSNDDTMSHFKIIMKK